MDSRAEIASSAISKGAGATLGLHLGVVFEVSVPGCYEWYMAADERKRCALEKE